MRKPTIVLPEELVRSLVQQQAIKLIGPNGTLKGNGKSDPKTASEVDYFVNLVCSLQKPLGLPVAFSLLHHTGDQLTGGFSRETSVARLAFMRGNKAEIDAYYLSAEFQDRKNEVLKEWGLV